MRNLQSGNMSLQTFVRKVMMVVIFYYHDMLLLNFTEPGVSINAGRSVNILNGYVSATFLDGSFCTSSCSSDGLRNVWSYGLASLTTYILQSRFVFVQYLRVAKEIIKRMVVHLELLRQSLLSIYYWNSGTYVLMLIRTSCKFVE